MRDRWRIGATVSISAVLAVLILTGVSSRIQVALGRGTEQGAVYAVRAKAKSTPIVAEVEAEGIREPQKIVDSPSPRRPAAPSRSSAIRIGRKHLASPKVRGKLPAIRGGIDSFKNYQEYVKKAAWRFLVYSDGRWLGEFEYAPRPRILPVHLESLRKSYPGSGLRVGNPEMLSLARTAAGREDIALYALYGRDFANLLAGRMLAYAKVQKLKVDDIAEVRARWVLKSGEPDLEILGVTSRKLARPIEDGSKEDL